MAALFNTHICQKEERLPETIWTHFLTSVTMQQLETAVKKIFVSPVEYSRSGCSSFGGKENDRPSAAASTVRPLTMTSHTTDLFLSSEPTFSSNGSAYIRTHKQEDILISHIFTLSYTSKHTITPVTTTFTWIDQCESDPCWGMTHASAWALTGHVCTYFLLHCDL